jgi:hypothetical protein
MTVIGLNASRSTTQHFTEMALILSGGSTTRSVPEINIDLEQLTPRLEEGQISNTQLLITLYSFVHCQLLTTVAWMNSLHLEVHDL